MKKYLLALSFLSLVLFVDYVVLVLIACASNACGAECQFFQGPFKLIGYFVVGFSLVGTVIYLRGILPNCSD